VWDLLKLWKNSLGKVWKILPEQSKLHIIFSTELWINGLKRKKRFLRNVAENCINFCNFINPPSSFELSIFIQKPPRENSINNYKRAVLKKIKKSLAGKI
jgi:hypothetical protein